MLYVSTTVEIDLQDAFEDLTECKKCKFIDENIGNASNKELLSELKTRGLEIECERKPAIDYAQKTFFAGGITARDFLTDCLGIQHTSSIEEIFSLLEKIL
jgi:hypothetical protein